ncbi:hypothetical protein QWY14_13605 [Planococcus sp. N028]|uniref:Membrane-spanning protein n=1 Tax=Planococcus shixiaomingii TaxID=3058393 RepID=A0ABT8N4M9_9BACL|nr:hypothetical protein [Planococcus sp. N028]MDN7242844.1 hypothetical protein [Planococcus sp. N028]
MELTMIERGKKWERSVWWTVFILLAIGTCYMFAIGENTKVTMGVLTLLLMGAAAFIQRRLEHSLPSFFVNIVYGFIFISVGLGTFGGFYDIPHFDDFLHIISGIMLAIASWIILQKMVGEHLTAQLPTIFIGLYIICFSLASAAVWELMEFAGDKLLNFTIQGRNADDTMIDMIDGLVGGTITAFVILRQRKKK